MTRDQGKWTRTPDDEIYGSELLLPSFGIRIARSDPRTEAYPTSLGPYDFNPDSGDAFSISYLHRQGDASAADRSLMGMDPGYLRRVLLRILGDEEYGKVEDHYAARDRREVKPGGPEGEHPTYLNTRKLETRDPKAQVRVTDLRLANDIRPEDLKRELKSALPDLPLPVTADEVLRWKWKTLRKPKGMRSASDLIERVEWLEEERVRIMAISFAAAALCLFVDLDMKGLNEATREDLTQLVIELYRIIADLTAGVEKPTEQLSGLLAGQRGTKGGRPPDPDVKAYTALVLHRMGHPYFEISRRLDIRSPDPPEWKKLGIADEELEFGRNWKNRLSTAIKKILMANSSGGGRWSHQPGERRAPGFGLGHSHQPLSHPQKA